MGGRGSRIGFAVSAFLVLVFLYLPLGLIVLYAFNKTTVNSWPFPGFSTRWFVKLWHDPAPKDAAWLSVRVALFSTAFALVLGTGMAFAFARHRFFGRELVNFTVTLPIILPGVITGVALASFFLFAHTDLSVRTVVIGHTTFCIVLVFNNVLARLRRLSPSLEEASRDLGASGVQTFRYVTFPSIRTALIAGALLAFALSFDEIAVTFFLAGADTTTLPLWILGAFRNSQSLPEVNAVATVVLVISLPMIATAAYLMRDEGAGSRIVAE
ncbi:MAG TPA: ABC transporter permease [Thermoleophilaceae bacterium]|jgi:putative spermidine/putrescine transport system permease protein